MKSFSNSDGSHAKITSIQIKEQIDEIESKNAHWKRCQDGSYEMALSMTNYSELWKEYRRLLKEEN